MSYCRVGPDDGRWHLITGGYRPTSWQVPVRIEPTQIEAAIDPESVTYHTETYRLRRTAWMLPDGRRFTYHYYAHAPSPFQNEGERVLLELAVKHDLLEEVTF